MINKKRTGFIVLGLAALSLGTIGFSSWIISGIDGTVNKDVNVKVGDVVDKRLTYELGSEPTDDFNLNFDAKKGVSGEVISADPSQKEDEDLTFSFSFRIYAKTAESYSSAIEGKKVYLTFSSDNSNFKTAVSNGYILSPIAIDGKEHEETIASLAATDIGETSVTYTDPSGASNITRLTYSIENYTAAGKSGKTVKLTYSFAWGGVFKFNNPVELKSGDFSAAKTALDAIDAIDDTSLKLNVTLIVK